MNKQDEYLTQLSTQEKKFNKLYRSVITKFGFADCTMWVLYFLCSSDVPLSQQDLIEKMMFPKQTINSAVKGLLEKGLIKLEVIAGTRNKKNIILTDSGLKTVNETVKKLRLAEIQAIKKMGTKKLEDFIFLYKELFLSLNKSFQEYELLGDTNE